VQKADAVWTAIANGNSENVLNIEPSVRPPGTVLLTAPLGPLKDYRNFYFRSVFVPVVIMTIAVFIAGVGVTRQRWESTLLALLAASMSMFWQFECGSSQQASVLFDYSWGMIDTFQASLAAMAMAAFLVSAVRFEKIWIIPGLVTLALLPLLKPSGFVVSPLISLAWLGVSLRLARLHPKGLAHWWTKILGTAITLVIIMSGIALACLNSDYFSAKNIEFGKVALTQLRSLSFGVNMANAFIALFTGSMGKPLIVASVVMGAIAWLTRKKSIDTEVEVKAEWIAGIGLLVLFAGTIATYHSTLFMQVRYFFPIIAVATVLFTPILVIWSKRVGKHVLVMLALIPTCLLIFLASPRLSVMANTIAGYGLFTGCGRKEASAANDFINEFRKTNTAPPVLFTTSNGCETNYFESAFISKLRKIGVSEPHLIKSVTRPLDWGNGQFVVRIDSIYNADVLAITRPSPTLGKIEPKSFAGEMAAMGALLATTPSTGSTKVLLQTPEMIALAVRDRPALERQMRKLIASRHWRHEFIAANGRKEFGRSELAKLHLGGLQITNPVDFESAVRVHSLSITRVPSEPKVNISIFSELLRKNNSTKYEFFIHQLNRKGEIISTHSVPTKSSRFNERPLIRDQFSLELNPNTVQLGVGVFEHTRGALVTVWPLATDWGGRRAKFNINKLPTATHSEDNP
jgi:hypothetical protein